MSLEQLNIESEKRRSGSRSRIPSGVVILDKPEGITSFQAVSKLKKWLGVKKAGHCGTLDPFATGILLVCLNQATRIADQLALQDKKYDFTVRFGVETDTLDKTGKIIRIHEGKSVSEKEVRKVVGRFQGPIKQQVPRYAAVKIAGKPLYEWTRKGIDQDQPIKEVTIYTLELTDFDWPFASFAAHCSKGTYVRQLASDMGRELGCGAHVTELRRSASGSFELTESVSWDELRTASPRSIVETKIIPMNVALQHLPQFMVENEDALKSLRNGILHSELEGMLAKRYSERQGPVRLVTPKGRLAALWWPPVAGDQHKRRRILRVFN